VIQIPMTPAQFAAKKQQLQAEHGIILDGPSGAFNSHGARVAYSYDGSATLDVTVTEAPMFIGKSHCEQIVKNWLTA
jgi:predicted NUDIX family NTP pyrophosphohydrolase